MPVAAKKIWLSKSHLSHKSKFWKIFVEMFMRTKLKTLLQILSELMLYSFVNLKKSLFQMIISGTLKYMNGLKRCFLLWLSTILYTPKINSTYPDNLPFKPWCKGLSIEDNSYMKAFWKINLKRKFEPLILSSKHFQNQAQSSYSYYKHSSNDSFKWNTHYE